MSALNNTATASRRLALAGHRIGMIRRGAPASLRNISRAADAALLGNDYGRGEFPPAKFPVIFEARLRLEDSKVRLREEADEATEMAAFWEEVERETRI